MSDTQFFFKIGLPVAGIGALVLIVLFVAVGAF
jgi:hypothetical protein